MPEKQETTPLDSYLSTTELLELTGISRKALRVYEREGICAPALVKSDYYKYWTFDQAQELARVHRLVDNGVPTKQIAALMEESEGSLLDLSYRRALARERASRRDVKDLWLQRLNAEGRRRVKGIDGSWYLRYIPQRWLALAPVLPHVPGLLSPGQFKEAHRRVCEVAGIVGWAASALTGQLTSLGSDGNGSAYAYLQLANAPMPVPVGRRPADSGCYLSAAGVENSPLCSAKHCEECALFGREPSDGERERCDAAEADARERGLDLHDRTVMIDALSEPYISGAWSVFTKHRLGVDSRARELGVHGPTLRPRLMPHELALPYGVTACVLPQGVYLCKTCASSEAASTHGEMTRLANEMRTEDVTPERERAALEKALFAHERSGGDAAERIGRGFDKGVPGGDVPLQRGFSREPLAATLSESNPELRNWCRSVSEEEELPLLELETNTALAPEDGYLVIASRLPGKAEAARGTFELQMLVNAGELGPGRDNAESPDEN